MRVSTNQERMKNLLAVLAAVAAMIAGPAYAAQCVCTAGCVIAGDPFPLGANNDQPTSCKVLKNGTVIATAPVVLSSTIPLTNVDSCLPPDPTYNPGPAGSVACAVPIPAQPVGTVALVVYASNEAGDSAVGTSHTFDNVAALKKKPPAVTNTRVNKP